MNTLSFPKKNTSLKKVYFLWDYDLSEDQILTILHGDNEVEKLWLIARIITHAKFEDIWKYINVEDIIKVFTKLRLSPRVRQNWQHTFNVWGYYV